MHYYIRFLVYNRQDTCNPDKLGPHTVAVWPFFIRFYNNTTRVRISSNQILHFGFLKNDIVLFKKFVKRVITIFEILSVNSASTTVVISFTATMKMWTHNSLSGSTFASWFYFPANRAVTLRTIGIVCAKRIGIHYSSGRSGQVQNFENLPHFWHTLQVQNVSRHRLDISPSTFQNVMS